MTDLQSSHDGPKWAHFRIRARRSDMRRVFGRRRGRDFRPSLQNLLLQGRLLRRSVLRILAA
jgi:hypothetical protein